MLGQLHIRCWANSGRIYSRLAIKGKHWSIRGIDKLIFIILPRLTDFLFVSCYSSTTVKDGVLVWSHCISLQWRHDEHDGVSSHQRLDYLPNRLFRRWSKKTSGLRVTGLCAGNSPVIAQLPAQRASNAENGSTWWRHHVHYALYTATFCMPSCKYDSQTHFLLCKYRMNSPLRLFVAKLCIATWRGLITKI